VNEVRESLDGLLVALLLLTVVVVLVVVVVVVAVVPSKMNAKTARNINVLSIY